MVKFFTIILLFVGFLPGFVFSQTKVRDSYAVGVEISRIRRVPLVIFVDRKVEQVDGCISCGVSSSDYKFFSPGEIWLSWHSRDGHFGVKIEGKNIGSEIRSVLESRYRVSYEKETSRKKIVESSFSSDKNYDELLCPT